MAKQVVKIIVYSKPTFFVNDKTTKISFDDLIFETRAEICTNVEMYFYKLLNDHKV